MLVFYIKRGKSYIRRKYRRNTILPPPFLHRGGVSVISRGGSFAYTPSCVSLSLHLSCGPYRACSSHEACGPYRACSSHGACGPYRACSIRTGHVVGHAAADAVHVRRQLTQQTVGQRVDVRVGKLQLRLVLLHTVPLLRTERVQRLVCGRGITPMSQLRYDTHCPTVTIDLARRKKRLSFFWLVNFCQYVLCIVYF